jgi:prepilin-type N-terminal cleavage/methylation domain-containing protein
MLAKVHLRPKERAGFTLVEIMIVVGIIALLAALALPGMIRARKRAQASRVKDDLRLIEAAVDQYAIETQRQPGSVVSVTDWTAYLKTETHLCTTGKDVLGHDFGPQTVDQIPTVPSETYAQLADVADDGFWAPFSP